MPTFPRALSELFASALVISKLRCFHQYATLEHLLLERRSTIPMRRPSPRACSVDLDKLRTSSVNYLETEFENLLTDGADDAKLTASLEA